MINYYITEYLPQGDTLGQLEHTINSRDEEHTHAYFDIIIPISGEGRQFIDGKSYDIKCGNIYFIDRSIPHFIIPEGELRYRELLIAADFFESQTDAGELRRIFYTDSEYQPALSLTEEERGVLDFILRSLERENKRRAGDFRTLMRMWVKLMGQYFARAMERARSELANRDPLYVLSVALEYVDKHFTENISQEELAERFRYNSAYFSRMFKKHKGMNLSDYITGKRIDYAAELLSGTDMSAEQISETVGYKSKPQFYNTFVRIKGVTPRQYRLENKK
ncbi:MAG: helix-turn-helix domain-containing protein [Clostridia bacterium]|nr:helix-turn-helix domain-containing protein [Clostridia bacterium]